MRRKPGYLLKNRPLHPESLMMSYGYNPKLSEGSLKCPIFQTSTFVFDSAEQGKESFEIAYGLPGAPSKEKLKLIYSRLNNPDLEVLEDRLTVWDNAEACAVFPSGMAAISTTFLEFLKPGDALLYTEPLYGGTHHFIHNFLKSHNIASVAVPAGCTREQAEAKLQESRLSTRLALIFLETPANPTNEMVDLEMFVQLAQKFSQPQRKVLVGVDNTFLGPVFQHPLKFGVDLVIYSATKFIGGHSDLIAGVCLGSMDLITRVKTLRTFLGTVPDPWTGWLLLRSLETLKLRMTAQCENAIKVADYLSRHPLVQNVVYPTLLKQGTHQRKLYEKQCHAPGSMISFEIKGRERDAFRFLNSLKMIHLAVSLGGTESLAQHPATMTHSDVSQEDKQRYGITESLIRLSVGVENSEDIIRDLEQALEAVGSLEFDI